MFSIYILTSIKNVCNLGTMKSIHCRNIRDAITGFRRIRGGVRVAHSAKTCMDKTLSLLRQPGLPVDFLIQINDLKGCIDDHSSKCTKQTKVDDFLKYELVNICYVIHCASKIF